MCWISMFFRCCSLEELSLFAIDWKFWYLKTLQEPSCLYILHEYVKSRYFQCTDTLICKGSLERTLQEISKAKPCKQIKNQMSSYHPLPGMREPWPEKCWQIKKHRELEQTIGQQRICPDCSELPRITKVVAAPQTLSSTRGFICCCVREVISWYNDISLRGGISSTRLICLHSPNH